MIDLDLVVLWCDLDWNSCGAKHGGGDSAGFDCFVVREHGGVIDLHLVVLWCQSMGK